MLGNKVKNCRSIFDVAGRRRRICETQGSPHEEGVLYALGFKVGTSLKVLESGDFFLFFVKYSSSGSAPTWSPCQWLASTKHLAKASSPTTTSYRLSGRLVAFRILSFKCFESVFIYFCHPRSVASSTALAGSSTASSWTGKAKKSRKTQFSFFERIQDKLSNSHPGGNGHLDHPCLHS